MGGGVNFETGLAGESWASSIDMTILGLWSFTLTDWWKICKWISYPRHYNLLLIRNRSWILTIHKTKILRKKPLEKTFLDFKKWIKSIQTAGYNGACTVDRTYLLYIHIGYINSIACLSIVSRSWMTWPHK